MKRSYQAHPLAELTEDGWTARLMVEAETALVYGVVVTPDTRVLETPHPIGPGEDLQQAVRELLDDYKR